MITHNRFVKSKKNKLLKINSISFFFKSSFDYFFVSIRKVKIQNDKRIVCLNLFIYL